MVTSATYRGCTAAPVSPFVSANHTSSTPVFDPAIRPKDRRSRIAFPLDACWLLDSHQGQDEKIYGRSDLDVGPARMRRKYTEVPHVRSAKLFLTFAESKIFHEWYEWTLGVGQLRFIAQFHDVGRGLRWFEAEFTEPWQAEYVALGEAQPSGVADRAWRISVKFRLYGEGELTNPLVGPSYFKANLQLPLVSENRAEAVKYLTATITSPLTSLVSDVTLSANFSAPLVSLVEPEGSLHARFYTYLAGNANIRGRSKFSAKFTAPLT